jgi:DnaJ-domain-containing protein 1
MGLFGAIVGGIIGGAVGGGWGALAGAFVGSEIGNNDYQNNNYPVNNYPNNNYQRSYSEIRFLCPHCNRELVASKSMSGVFSCDFCKNPIILSKCPHCNELAISVDIGGFICNNCKKEMWIGVCKSCREIAVTKSKTASHRCGGQVVHILFNTETEIMFFLVSTQVALMVEMGFADGHFDESQKDMIRRIYLEQGFSGEAIELINKMIMDFSSRRPSVLHIVEDANEVLEYNDKLIVLEYLFRVLLANQTIDKGELDLLDRIKSLFEIRESDYDNMYAFYIKKSEDSDILHYYSILELRQDCSDVELKAQYRLLVKQYHPDKYSYMGNEMFQMAHIKFKEIKNAYEKILDFRRANFETQDDIIDVNDVW